VLDMPGFPDISERGPVSALELYIDRTDVRQGTKPLGFEQAPLSSIRRRNERHWPFSRNSSDLDNQHGNRFLNRVAVGAQFVFSLD
jgi:hypothetical protein